jgi:hypothetical protein
MEIGEVVCGLILFLLSQAGIYTLGYTIGAEKERERLLTSSGTTPGRGPKPG